MPVTPYLFFDGRCEEALDFYKKALGAKVEMMMRYKESPEPPPPGMNIFTRSGLVARTFSLSGVSMKPGPMALTRTPSLPSSAASARVKPSTPCFEVV